ncbi:MAG: hypothetical protein ACRENU_15495 [Gemmatimonadaceae bacterium]
MSVPTPRAPYSLSPTAFPFPALASMAGRAPLGGPREVALACFLVARIVDDGRIFPSLPPELRLQRVHGIKHWLGAASIPTAIRNALSRLADATAAGDSSAVRTALDSVMTVTANQLDPGARLELTRLAQAIAG